MKKTTMCNLGILFVKIVIIAIFTSIPLIILYNNSDFEIVILPTMTFMFLIGCAFSLGFPFLSKEEIRGAEKWKPTSSTAKSVRRKLPILFINKI